MIKKLAACIGEYKKQTVIAPVSIIFEVVMEVLIPLVMARLIDYGIDRSDMDATLKYGLILVACALLSLTFGVVSGYFAATASAGFAKNLRKKMYYNVQEFSFMNIDKFSTASLVTRLTTDVSRTQNAFQMIIRMAFRAPVTMIFASVMAFSINARLALILVAFMPLLLICIVLFTNKVHPIFRRVFKTYDRLNSIVQENVRGIRVVKSFVREKHETEKFNAVSGSIYEDFSKAEKLMTLVSPIMQFCVYGCTLLISWFGARAIVASGGDPAVGMSTGNLMSMFTYVVQILISLMMVSAVFVMITISRASAERIVEVLDEKSDLTNNGSGITEVPDGSVVFEDVSFAYKKDGRCCLEDVDLKIKSGETIGILGGTGVGKSTLVQLIPRLYDTAKGRVLVGGIDVRDYDIEALRGAVSMVLQKNVLFSGTVKENLRWGDENATDDELKHVCELARADEFIGEMSDGYDTVIEQGGANVSGGQKQRLCIARALLKKPKILILDDSTSAVDMRTDALIREAFREELPDVTKIIIAQRVASVMDADRIVVMENGRIDGFGTHDELMKTNAVYREVYESQTKGDSDDETA